MDKYFIANAELSKFSRDYMEHKRNVPIRPSEMGILDVVTSFPDERAPARIAKIVGVSKPMITAHINALLNKGYVTKEPSPHDKRSFYVYPTQKGIELIEKANRQRDELIEYLIDNMGEEDFDMLISLVQKANRAFAKKITEENNTQND